MESQVPMTSSMGANPQQNEDVESVKRYMDCVDDQDEDEVAMATVALAKPHQISTRRTRKSASDFSFNTGHSSRESDP